MSGEAARELAKIHQQLGIAVALADAGRGPAAADEVAEVRHELERLPHSWVSGSALDGQLAIAQALAREGQTDPARNELVLIRQEMAVSIKALEPPAPSAVAAARLRVALHERDHEPVPPGLSALADGMAPPVAIPRSVSGSRSLRRDRIARLAQGRGYEAHATVQRRERREVCRLWWEANGDMIVYGLFGLVVGWSVAILCVVLGGAR